MTILEMNNKFLEEKIKAISTNELSSEIKYLKFIGGGSFELKGFIDPCGAMWADREYDLFQLRNMWGDSYGLYEEYKRQNTLSEYADFKIAYYAALNEASCRLQGGLIMPLWEILCNRRLRREMKKIRSAE